MKLLSLVVLLASLSTISSLVCWQGRFIVHNTIKEGRWSQAIHGLHSEIPLQTCKRHVKQRCITAIVEAHNPYQKLIYTGCDSHRVERKEEAFCDLLVMEADGFRKALNCSKCSTDKCNSVIVEKLRLESKS